MSIRIRRLVIRDALMICTCMKREFGMYRGRRSQRITTVWYGPMDCTQPSTSPSTVWIQSPRVKGCVR